MENILHLEPPPGSLVRFISDLHLAHKRGLAPDDLLEQMQGVDILVLCGDTAETRETCIERERSMELRESLREQCRQKGIQLVELAGNHDPDTAPLLALLWEGRVAATHGHAILREISPWSREYMNAKTAVRALIRACPEAEHSLEARLELTRRIAQELSRRVPPPKRGEHKRSILRELYHCFWPPSRPLSIVWSWLTCGPRAERWVRRFCPKTEVFIFGHFHRGGRWKYGKRTILNTGAWFEHARPYAVDMRDGKLVSYHPLRPLSRS